MNAKGLRIRDVSVQGIIINFCDLFSEIQDLKDLHWSIYDFDEALIKKEFINEKIDYGKIIRNSPKGLVLDWDGLIEFDNKFDQFIDATFIGCKSLDQIYRGKYMQDYFETCEVVMTVFDSAYWEVFTTDENFYNRLLNKFKKTEPLETDFLDYL